MVVTVDRGRWGVVLGGDPDRLVTTMRARELGCTPIVASATRWTWSAICPAVAGHPGPGSCAEAVPKVLRRTADDTDPTERWWSTPTDEQVVATLADPPPRTGLVDWRRPPPTSAASPRSRA